MLDVVLVGNGPSAIATANGPLIDTAVDVARINNFVTKGFEQFVGTRTTIWVRNDTKTVCDRLLPGVSVLYVCRPDRKQAGYLVPVQFSQSCWASTGVTAALYLLQYGRQVTLTGFDFFTAASHHYFPSNSANKHHDPVREQALLAPYFSTGQLTRLGDKP